MGIDIDQMETEVTVQPSNRSGQGETDLTSLTENQLKALLRPIVMALFEEELERYQRTRG